MADRMEFLRSKWFNSIVRFGVTGKVCPALLFLPRSWWKGYLIRLGMLYIVQSQQNGLNTETTRWRYLIKGIICQPFSAESVPSPKLLYILTRLAKLGPALEHWSAMSIPVASAMQPSPRQSLGVVQGFAHPGPSGWSGHGSPGQEVRWLSCRKAICALAAYLCAREQRLALFACC